ncbi:ABC transporter substrate-binding protein [Celeribacter sp. SCSIO 80788]|uniref:ABC transporter substrate-binding protein n=1 Tax=Celeribacter sp. SCSIO 80788 TaxID=3117013 RepID=UPI003DA23134
MKRRQFLQTGAALSLAAPFYTRAAFAEDPIRIAQIHDASGGLDIYGLPMIEMLRYAVEQKNAAGGVLGRPIELIDYDPQSNLQYYTQYATEAATRDRVAAVFGGITSASREAIRPILRRYGVPYFYATNYEGGVCDRNIFITASTPGQSISTLMPFAAQNFGKRVYIVAADYNFGHLSAEWVRKFATDLGLEVINASFFPLDVTDFGAELQKIQSEKPDFVFSALVGGAHLSFYRQWAAAGLNETPIVSSTFGGGNEQVLLSPTESRNIYSAYAYYEDVDNPANATFVEAFRATERAKKVPYINELGMMTYCSFELWTKAVERAGTTERMPVIEALEAEGRFDGPAGQLIMDPKTHHTALNIYVAQANGARFDILEEHKALPPLETAMQCDLVANPDDTEQYIVRIAK